MFTSATGVKTIDTIDTTEYFTEYFTEEDFSDDFTELEAHPTVLETVFFFVVLAQLGALIFIAVKVA